MIEFVEERMGLHDDLLPYACVDMAGDAEFGFVAADGKKCPFCFVSRVNGSLVLYSDISNLGL